MKIAQSLDHHPVFPSLLSKPLSFLPVGVYNRAFCAVLNILFRQERFNDELDFLQGRRVCIQVDDLNLRLMFTLHQRNIMPVTSTSRPELVMQGLLYDFLLLMSGREDPDTLFFNRRLKLKGDTELGLYLKNFLDGLELEDKRALIYTLSDQARRIAERFS